VGADDSGMTHPYIRQICLIISGTLHPDYDRDGILKIMTLTTREIVYWIIMNIYAAFDREGNGDYVD